DFVQFAHLDQQWLVRLLPEVLDFDGQAGRLTDVSSSVVLTCLFVFQQLQVGPVPSAVGQVMVVRATKLRELTSTPGLMPSAQGPAAGVEVTLEGPDLATRVLGVTGSDGLLRFVAQDVGPMAV